LPSFDTESITKWHRQYWQTTWPCSHDKTLSKNR